MVFTKAELGSHPQPTTLQKSASAYPFWQSGSENAEIKCDPEDHPCLFAIAYLLRSGLEWRRLLLQCCQPLAGLYQCKRQTGIDIRWRVRRKPCIISSEYLEELAVCQKGRPEHILRPLCDQFGVRAADRRIRLQRRRRRQFRPRSDGAIRPGRRFARFPIWVFQYGSDFRDGGKGFGKRVWYLPWPVESAIIRNGSPPVPCRPRPRPWAQSSHYPNFDLALPALLL